MTCTNPFISARHAAGAPDFSGPGFSEARRIILIAPESSPDMPDTSPDAGAQVPDDVDRRSRIAARLAELTEEMSALTAELSAHEEAPPDSTDGATGEAMELG
jgi:hypothetical protein|tara:strand:+ start:2314 stop:2622 length:309 start_codon:yes stop_codon:yes gene_type:complete